MAALGRDVDDFDAVCDHLLVIDHTRPSGAVVDHQFGTTDIFVLLPMERLAARYLTHFERVEPGFGA
jgi:putative hemolysin